MRRTPLALAPLFALLLTPACHTGLEVAGIERAYAHRNLDGHVTVVATLACVLVKGRGRGQGCDADDTNVCVEATWYDVADAARTKPLFVARSCTHQTTIIGAKATVISDVPIPPLPPTTERKEGLVIDVQTDARVNSPLSTRAPLVLVPSP